MLLIAALACVATLFGFVSWQLLHHATVGPRVWSVGAAVLVFCVGLGVKLAYDNSTADVQGESPTASLVQSMAVESIAWPGNQWLRTRPQRTLAAAAPIEAAPIDSLIGGLEARLVTEPDDGKGWALLAQSYAFMGKRDAAEQALVRAVKLGMDEKLLRLQIEAAGERVQHSNWIQQAIGG